MASVSMSPEALRRWGAAQRVVDNQADDPALWAETPEPREQRLQAALRRLHTVVEGGQDPGMPDHMLPWPPIASDESNGVVRDFGVDEDTGEHWLGHA